jgi:hypothetical protein
MTKPLLSNFASVAPMMIQRYERYLPTSFDESMSLVEKVNKVIVYLNQIGEITNDVVDQWNTVMEWVTGDGIADTINERLDAMVTDGTLDDIINHAIFDDLNQQITDLTQDLTDGLADVNKDLTDGLAGVNEQITVIQGDVTANTNQILKIGVDVKTLGALANYVDDINRGTDDTTVFQNALNNGGIIFIPKGNYFIAGQLSVKSNTRLIFSPDAKLYTYSDKAFYFASGVENVRIEQARIFNKNQSVTYAYYMDGNASGGYNTSVKNVVIEHGYAEAYTWSFYVNALRKSTISNFHGWSRNGFSYNGKSAENVITDSNFIKYDETVLANTKGFYSEATTEGYPEGLTVLNTLFYHYERNIHIKDMYVGKFNNCYLDGGLDGCLPSLVEYNSRSQFNTFTDTWCLNRGFQLGVDGYTVPKEFRIKFNNTFFDACKTTGFELKAWVRACEFNNTTFYGTIDADQTAFIGRNQNNFFKINGFIGRFLSGFLSVYGNGGGMEANNISNYDNLANNGVYREYGITYNGTAM